MSILVCGGAGYVGSHCLEALKAAGYDCVVVDDLSRGHRAAVGESPLYVGNIADDALMDQVFRERHIEVVLHFAAASQVGESMKEPLLYYENNLCATVALLRSMRRHEVGRIVFSSSAAVYGEPDTVPIPEESPKAPTNTYGETKLAMERLMHWCHVAYGLEYVSLRYFNAAGASPSGIIGEDHTPETHLIPLVLQAAQGRREKVSIFGDDYPTPDGTCIRDYIHTSDLASAHLLAARPCSSPPTARPERNSAGCPLTATPRASSPPPGPGTAAIRTASATAEFRHKKTDSGTVLRLNGGGPFFSCVCHTKTRPPHSMDCAGTVFPAKMFIKVR